ncbi:MAG: universal stress protein [Actinobacteria bacterium]|nr:MAG: universal stress protein [Actinomycetota bacterium]
MPVIDTILVAYDDPTSGTLARAADLAEAVGSRLVVTNVAAPVEPSAAEEAGRISSERLDEARTYLEQRGVGAELVPRVGSPAEAIVELARERKVGLIVVGTRKKGFLERLVEGSVAENVLRHATCDVLVVY